jgi:hypothetical protein
MMLLKVGDCDGKYGKSQSSSCDFLCRARSYLFSEEERGNWTLSQLATSGLKTPVTAPGGLANISKKINLCYYGL